MEGKHALWAGSTGRERRRGGHSTRGGRQTAPGLRSCLPIDALPRAAPRFPAAEIRPQPPPKHPHAAAPTKAPLARYRRAQSPTMATYEPVPARVPLHLGVSRADSSR